MQRQRPKEKMASLKSEKVVLNEGDEANKIKDDSSNSLCLETDQNDCMDTGFQSLESKDKPLFLKDLMKIWELWPGRFSPSNTLLIDERPYKALINPPYTGIFPEPYGVEDPGDDALGPKGELRMYLKGLADAEDVPSYLKEHKFGQPAMAPGHPDWGFYVKVQDKYGPAIIQQDMKTAPSEAQVKLSLLSVTLV
ncbi:FCP1 homology domain [Dillenia turbinata]|uniref:FCP1 homology domain n=1 Tax=Dillenia turbinata TaxID=194707 RepID=A0AAN8W8Q7_9MAGN